MRSDTQGNLIKHSQPDARHKLSTGWPKIAWTAWYDIRYLDIWHVNNEMWKYQIWNMNDEMWKYVIWLAENRKCEIWLTDLQGSDLVTYWIIEILLTGNMKCDIRDLQIWYMNDEMWKYDIWLADIRKYEIWLTDLQGNDLVISWDNEIRDMRSERINMIHGITVIWHQDILKSDFVNHRNMRNDIRWNVIRHVENWLVEIWDVIRWITEIWNITSGNMKCDSRKTENRHLNHGNTEKWHVGLTKYDILTYGYVEIWLNDSRKYEIWLTDLLKNDLLTYWNMT